MAKNSVIPTPEQIKQAYIEELLRRNPFAEQFANFTEKELAEFIRKYVEPTFAGIYECTDHKFYDQVRSVIATNPELDEVDKASDFQYSVHLRTYSEFLQSNAFKNLFKSKSKTETKREAKFREETEGERKHISKERDVVSRNPKLRQQCIDKYGYQCQCCGMDFAEMYGEELGTNFIEVHHLKPISTFEKDGVPENFLENLVPLCSNCHSMIHHIKETEHSLRDLREAYRGERKELKIRKDD